MSVKLAVSDEPEHRRFNLEAINNILANTENSFFKFVCGSVKDVEEGSRIIKKK